MRTNHFPVTARLRDRITKLEAKREAAWVPGRKGNPYRRCNHCNVHAPEFSIRGRRHFKGCMMHGIEREIAHYRRLLDESNLVD